MDTVLVVIARPGSAALDAEAVATVRRHAPGDPNWLAEREAFEMHIGDAPRDLEPALRHALSARPVDVALVPARDRRKQLLVADMDSTVIGQECIDELATLAGVGDQVREVTRRAMAGELDFEASLKARVDLLKGLPANDIGRLLDTRISLTPGARTLTATMRAHGALTALVSGGFTAFTGPVAERAGFEIDRANQLVIEGGRVAGRVAEPILGRAAKVEVLDELAAARKASRRDVIAVGDGANDIGMITAAGIGVALHGKAALREVADVRIDHGDLTALLYLQGFSRDQFVSG
ncbi:MAG: phosphoserine phosphatase SerB [Hyphomicrobiales bacterium]